MEGKESKFADNKEDPTYPSEEILSVTSSI